LVTVEKEKEDFNKLNAEKDKMQPEKKISELELELHNLIELEESEEEVIDFNETLGN